MGVPVVTSMAGAGGVDAKADAHFYVARSPAETASCALRLMTNPDERARLAAAGRARMLSHHDWAASMRRLDGIVQQCLEIGSRAPRRAALTSPTQRKELA